MNKTFFAITFSSILLLMAGDALGQRWKQYRWDAEVGLGSTHFFGDLGGGSGEGSHFFSIKDLDLNTTRPLIHVGVRYRILELLSAKASFSWGMLSADDAYSASKGRRNRNLHFRSPIYELSTQLEFPLIKEKVRSPYAIAQGRLTNISAYIFAGIGGIRFNPKAQYEGNWYDLRPLGTEGQGIPADKLKEYQEHLNTQDTYTERPDVNLKPKDKYSLFAISIPVGLGAKYMLTSSWSVGVELGMRYTTTDYIDDVKNSYFNYYDYYDYLHTNKDKESADDLATNGGKEQLQIELSDRHLDKETGEVTDPEDKYRTGKSYRGSAEYNDAYFFTIINLTYKLNLMNKRGLPKYR